ncbi:hypothetical protein P3T39_000771 [Kitasatospora sp. GP82]|nr:hypothetical protein [Kitasatospora sp. GP82]MDH6576065.1 hypothetical protein [Kitasatospora sp. MAP5-34]
MRHPNDENEAFVVALFGLSMAWLLVLALLSGR